MELDFVIDIDSYSDSEGAHYGYFQLNGEVNANLIYQVHVIFIRINMVLYDCQKQIQCGFRSGTYQRPHHYSGKWRIYQYHYSGKMIIYQHHYHGKRSIYQYT